MSMDVDMRSEAPGELISLVESFHKIIRDAVEQENQTRSTTEGKIVADIKLIGDRPSGETSAGSPLLQTTTAAVKSFGLTPSYSIGSTDSNIPISLGIEAVTIGRGGAGGRSHSLDEWVDVEPKAAAKAAQIALAIVLGAAR
jgi:acetylornithine deacetylase/succinyl-diaminopimelate desuccinylase-like protein